MCHGRCSAGVASGPTAVNPPTARRRKIDFAASPGLCPAAMHTRTALLALLAVAAIGCGGSSKEPSAPPPAGAPAAATASEVIATYDGKQLTSVDVLAEFERLPVPSRAYIAAPDRKRQFVENLILNDLLFREGQSAGYDKDPDIDRQVADLRKRLVVQKVMRKYQTPPEITDQQAKDYYEKNRQLYSGLQVRASHILVKDEATAKALSTELRAHPEKFAELAKERSTDTASAQKGGDLGMFGQGRMVPEFEAAAFALKPNEISDPVKTQYGYHVIMITERKEGEQKPFDQVKEQIKAMLRNKAMQDQVQNHFDALKKSANLTIDDAALAKVTPPSAGPPLPGGSGH